MAEESSLALTKHVNQEANRLVLSFFVLGGLEILGELDKLDKKKIIDFVYSLQVLPDKDDPKKNELNCGFRASPFYGIPWNPNCERVSSHIHDQCHITMTQTALLILAMCRDKFEKVQRKPILKSIRALQQPDGSFACAPGGTENDMRFLYCAASVCFMLNDFSGMDIDKAVEYILSSQSYDGAIGQGPGQESHGGPTYCAVAALHLMGKLDLLPRKKQLIQWCVERQISGFQGRINKLADTCYSFWIGATLVLLGAFDLVDFTNLQGFALSCETSMGGLGKIPHVYPDVLHTYLGFCGLSFTGEPGLNPIDCGLVISKQSFQWILSLRDNNNTK